MKNTVRTLLVLIGLASSTSLLAQMKVTTQVAGDVTTGKQLLQATVTGGSGNYSYAWGLNTPGTVPENTASEALLVPTQDAEYIVFVRDKKTGVTAYSTVVVKAPVETEKHLIRMPGEGNGSKYRYFPTGALQANPSKK